MTQDANKIMDSSGDKKNERLKSQITALHSGNRTTILVTLDKIRSMSNISILPELFDLLMVQEDEEIVRGITSLLNDLKLQEAAPVLADAIANPEYETIQTRLIAACWQNGLSYGEYADTFVHAAIHGSFETTIEAFTVLEEAIGELEKEERLRLTARIRDAMSTADQQKQLLLKELIKVMESYGY